ncbi:hypothetical protein T12_7166 [Trichinella patagoniensis]|uniref:MULE transposase domain-containing protein n=1 Tax=Trichinella patagoniensis TaxID=990121 RepID=A0A0V1A569_9BILA|nr:hypothetical protein T12_7166 [Trichinella patagoniensis]
MRTILSQKEIKNPKGRGGTSLVYEGRAYKLRYTGKRVKNWGCSKDKKECKGGLTTNLDVTGVLRRTPHGDSCPVYEHIAYKMDLTILRKRSAEEARTIPQIHDEEAASISAEPSTFSQHPKNCQDVVLGTEFTRTKFGEVFLLTQSASNHIPRIDGTFNVVPQWYLSHPELCSSSGQLDIWFRYPQLFAIHAFSAGKLVPAICLCTNKDIGTYEFIFEALISRAAALEVDLNPDTIICDFETALIPAIQGYFPKVRVQCCNSTSAKRYIGKSEAQFVMETLISQLLSGNPAAGSIRQISNRYAEKQRRVMMYRGECISDRRTVEQFLQDLIGRRSSSRTNSAQLYRAVDVDQVQRKIERLVRSANEPLRKDLGKALLDEEEPRTLLCEVESCFNSWSSKHAHSSCSPVRCTWTSLRSKTEIRQGAVPISGGADGATVTRV